MGLTDKVTGRVKKAAADLTGDGELHREGRREERKGEAKEELLDAERKADEAKAAADAKADEVASLERNT